MSPQEPTGSYMQWHATPSAGYEASNQSPSSSTHPQNPYDSSHGTAVTSYSRSLQPATSGQPYYTAATTPPVYSHRVAQSTPTWPHTSTQSYQTTASTPASHGHTRSQPYLSPGGHNPSSASPLAPPTYTYQEPHQQPQSYPVSEQPVHPFSVAPSYTSSNSYTPSSSATHVSDPQSHAYYSPYSYQHVPSIQLPDNEQHPDNYAVEERNANYSNSPSPSAASPGQLESKTPSRTNSGKE
ncbi:hypothetical protein BU16DRAFT_533050 [Lophium mytilinum]|uniref:Uncharacterized protein n=1 Tax=Lophium mytilinum TaxID=390894 RepID=A0A6A6RDA3_9PEZI|nr:hypothetical protein BU16DRAFT_533050 [Lophium mytilinum]